MATISKKQVNEMSDNKVKFTEEDIDSCWYHSKAYMVEILNGEYSLVEARDDLLSLIGSKHDLRTKPTRAGE